MRTAPGSRRLPHFAKAALAAELPPIGVQYVHLPELGGLRRANGDSINTGWRNASFRSFADYMQTEAFEAGLERLPPLTHRRRADRKRSRRLADHRSGTAVAPFADALCEGQGRAYLLSPGQHEVTS
ncbi:MAG: DUF488 domain-containing protein [Candidatus Dormibacter sp.]|uniref:DUF488 domain-containing protein n=1 Tax=Candidatus Dormibacter sp. TaxID=2973982 RepID=UPI003D9AE237